jgi:prepilin-type processing-associated H-X9-DG protein
MTSEFQDTRTSKKAVWSLILGLSSLLCSVFTGIPAVIMGILGLTEVSRGQGSVRGQGFAIAGIVTGSIGMLLVGPLIIAVLIGLLLPGVQKVREAANRMHSSNNLKQIVLAMYNYHDSQHGLPPAVVYSKEGKPLYSWRVLLLPYIEQQDLYAQFHLDEPWDSPHNRQFITQMPNVYADPSRGGQEDGGTVYQVIVGTGTAFEERKDKPLKIPDDFPKGTSNTLLLVEALDAVPWTKPADLTFHLDQPLPKFSNRHSGGFQAAFVDGAVRPITKETSEQALRNMILRTGN